MDQLTDITWNNRPASRGISDRDAWNIVRQVGQIFLSVDRICIPATGGGFEQCYNTQVVATADSLPSVARHLIQAVNEKRQVIPLVDRLEGLPEERDHIQDLAADGGYLIDADVGHCVTPGIKPLIALRREPHHKSW